MIVWADAARRYIIVQGDARLPDVKKADVATLDQRSMHRVRHRADGVVPSRTFGEVSSSHDEAASNEIAVHQGAT